MQVINTVAEMVAARNALPRPLGLVPTMGFLHEGHMTLARWAKRDCRSVVASIFVNPTQFGPGEDFAAYPRDVERDLAMLRKEGVDIVFSPRVEEVYPQGFSTYVNVEKITDVLEGARRPGHFRGVATVVAKLFTVVRPDKSYFGQKDGQQVAVIKRMTVDLALGTEVVVVPTVREPDGLAMSSRNVYLTPAERTAAPVLYRALCLARDMHRDGVHDAKSLRAEMERMINAEPLGKLDYVSLADAETLQEVTTVERPVMISLACRFGRARLIDNVVIGQG